jgi:hypothetical protein
MSHNLYKHTTLNKDRNKIMNKNNNTGYISKNKIPYEKKEGNEENNPPSYNILNELKDYMFDSKNLRLFTKHNINIEIKSQPKHSKNLCVSHNNECVSHININGNKIVNKSKPEIIKKDTIYKPRQKDSLFWCFYIIKYGFSKYEMEIGNQHFLVEKQEKYRYIDLLRENKNKDLIKLHKIKPLTILEDDLANQDRISIKTFFALCIIENINMLLIDKRKIYEIITTDDPKIHVVYRNSITYEHHIELDVPTETINKYRETYYKMPSFDVSLKSMTSYKIDELLELCKKLDINIETNNETNNEINNETNKDVAVKKKKKTKKDIYELLVLHF